MAITRTGTIRVTYTAKADKLKNELIALKNSIKSGQEYNYADVIFALENDLRATKGKPLNRGWKNIGPLRQLGKNVWHCHLDPKNVVIWKILENESGMECRIGYIGQRADAEY